MRWHSQGQEFLWKGWQILHRYIFFLACSPPCQQQRKEVVPDRLAWITTGSLLMNSMGNPYEDDKLSVISVCSLILLIYILPFQYIQFPIVLDNLPLEMIKCTNKGQDKKYFFLNHVSHCKLSSIWPWCGHNLNLLFPLNVQEESTYKKVTNILIK